MIDHELSFENELVKMWIEDGILFGYYKPGCRLDLEAIQKVVKDRITFCKGKTYPSYINITNIESISLKARAYMGSKASTVCISRAAVLAKTVMAHHFINLFFKLEIAPIPIKIFKKEETAIAWLKSFEN